MSSVRERVAARRRELSRQRNEGEMFMLPGYGGELWVRLAYMGPDENARINAEEFGGDGASIRAMAHKLAVYCRGIYESEDKTVEGATRIEHDGVPVGFDRDFAAWFGMLDEVTVDGQVDPVDVVLATMPKDWNVETLFDVWWMWLQFSSREVDETILGESKTTPTS